ncbi:hypothetical protein TNIN_313451 [Trichonephila inaurata madagascariensis]|uniref:Uncharacterized protein n=1 Tax=Trichonephila inaurata madagascariensis TaxID=2747483 RepID=A0A8X6XAX7_9ARAC|nr:hypothetical protein TNIN_313451 [Trichonephila inaurata madagascariensis]
MFNGGRVKFRASLAGGLESLAKSGAPPWILLLQETTCCLGPKLINGTRASLLATHPQRPARHVGKVRHTGGRSFLPPPSFPFFE